MKHVMKGLKFLSLLTSIIGHSITLWKRRGGKGVTRKSTWEKGDVTKV